MRIGKLLRTIFVEPLEQPVDKCEGDPVLDQLPQPESEPEPGEVMTT